MNLYKQRYAYNIDFGIRPGQKVLDLGGGHKPHPKATHVIDVKGNEQQRGYRPLLIKEKIKYLLNGAPDEFLQIEDNYFDFIYSSHCLEHVIDLEETIKQITRTCKRGFFSFPGSDFDFMMSWEHGGHIHALRESNGKILWCNKSRWFDDLAYQFQEKMYKPKHHLSLMENDYRYLWECRYYWEGKPLFEQVPANQIYPQMKYFS